MPKNNNNIGVMASGLLKKGKLLVKKKSKNKAVDRTSMEKRYNRKKLLTLASPYAIREAYTQLRTNMLFSVAADSAQQCKVFAVTSSNPTEGKSLTAANVAVSFAMLGKKTLIIDADMRKPAQHRLWGIENTSGLSNMLAKVGEACLYKVQDLPLSILTAGEIPPNPAELLTSAQFELLIEKFKSEYNFIIVDMPPINIVSDAQMVCAHTDSIVLVALSEETRTDDIERAEEAIKTAGGKICGIVINGVDYKKAKGSYSYKYSKDYRYKYSYSYEYGNETEQESEE